MADLSNNWVDGSVKWNLKNNVSSSGIPVSITTNTSNVINGLSATDIQTDVQNISIKILKNNAIVSQIAISGYCSHDLSGNIITIFTSDELPLILEFISYSEALNADARLIICLNGGLTT